MPPKKKKGKKGGKKKKEDGAGGGGEVNEIEEADRKQKAAKAFGYFKETQKEERDFNEFQQQREKLNYFWIVEKKKLEDSKAELRNKERELQDLEEKHQVEIKVYKQRVKHLLYEHQNEITRRKTGAETALKLSQDDHRLDEVELKSDRRALKLELKETELTHDDFLKSLKQEHDRNITNLRHEFERKASEVQRNYEKKTKAVRERLEERRKRETLAIEHAKNVHIEALMKAHEKAFAEIKNYYNDITHNNLDLIKSLKEEVGEMRRKEQQDEKQMEHIAQENRRMSEPFKKAREDFGALRWEDEVLRQRHAEVAAQKDALSSRFTAVAAEVKQKAQFKALLLEKKLDTVAETLEARDAQLDDALARANVDVAALGVGQRSKARDVVERKASELADLRAELARVADAHGSSPGATLPALASSAAAARPLYLPASAYGLATASAYETSLGIPIGDGLYEYENLGTNLSAFTVTAKYVRRELRDLTAADRNAYFSALHTLWRRRRTRRAPCGPDFKSAAWPSAASVCSHYWDYTIDAERAYGNATYVYTESELFDPDWFGPAVPHHPDHVVDEGRWAYARARGRARSPTSRTPGAAAEPLEHEPRAYLMRYNKVLGVYRADNFLPRCSEFQKLLLLGYNSVGKLFSELNGALHGSVHIMLGGSWDFDLATLKASGDYDDSDWRSDQMLLGSKFLWRQGLLDCPQECSNLVDPGDCTCSCGKRIPNSLNGSEHDARLFLEHSGVQTVITDAMVHKARDALGGYAAIVDALCHLIRTWARNGTFTLVEDWDYDHTTGVLSDTQLVCDWSAVGDSLKLPVPRGRVEGRENDTLPFEWPIAETTPGAQRYYTNAEFYELMAPWDRRVPYVYDKLEAWRPARARTS
ncbi:positive regulation of protein localization to cilium [Aureococcus anophagefferens]|nr:positive regulation of protein localization to cilium [Aureococcus anophagefferens]